MTSSCSASERRPEFSVRIVVCDYYLTKPTPGMDVTYSEFRGADIKQIPVLRIFGPTPDGHKACLHVHGVFPYFYIPCHLPNPQPQFLYQIATSLDKALNIALKQATSANQHVYKITLVRGLPFYGFHYKDHLYLKVFLYNPLLIKQAVELCSNGAILGQTFQPHESHINFTLQFFIDFNLFGMSNIDLQTVKFRKSGISQNSNEPVQSTDELNLKPESVCYYEADCIASHIINRQRIGKGNGIENPGLEEVWNQEMERRKQLNISLASKSLSQGRINADETESHYKFKEMFLIKISNLIDKPVNPIEVKKIENEIHYPAESMKGSQLFDAVDVSMHIPENPFCISLNKSLKRDLTEEELREETLTEDFDNSVVDESIALNSSLSICYSQVLLDSEDLELVNMLQDMDEKPIEEDSVMATPTEADREADEESDDVEYSQVFNEETILVETFKSKGDVDETSQIWNDSFWISGNIPQLDGACDDDHVKKVRKRKMRSFKLGLSKPKSKKVIPKHDEEVESINNESDLDEINVSRDIISNISELHSKKVLKAEYERLPDNIKDTNIEESNIKFETKNRSTVNLINEKTYNKSVLARSYDLHNCIEPIAGPSSHYEKVKDIEIENYSINNSHESIDENNSGIMSFYNASKIFDLSLQDDVENDGGLQTNIKEDNENLHEDNRKSQLDLRETPFITRMVNCIDKNTVILSPKIKPPTKTDIISSLDKYKIPRTNNSEPYYSDHKDVGDKVEIGQMLIKLKSRLSCDQKPFEKVLNTTSIEEWRQLLFIQTNESNDTSKLESLKILLAGNKRCILEPVKKPPTRNRVLEWLQQKESATMSENSNKGIHKEINIDVEEIDNSQTIGLHEDQINSSISLESNEKGNTKLDNTLQVTMQPDGSFLCFETEHTPNENSIDVPKVDVDFLTVMLMEVHTKVRGELNPDPLIDPIEAVFYTVLNDCPSEHFLVKSNTQIIVAGSTTSPKLLDRCVFNTPVIYVNNENDILEKVIELVKKHDPDIICGYEIEMNSWGYMLERSQVLGLEMVKEISRITEKHRQKRWRNDENEFEGRIIGRIMFNVWRLFRYELALSSYSFENCMHEVLNERVPKYSYAQLSKWWTDESRLLRWVTVEYYLTRLSGTVRMLEKLDIINRTSELARLFGLQWWEVLSRGSQFRVESLMLRAARPLNLVALSPTVKQRAAMRAPECLPLIFEPESRFYNDPVIVLDFQSLYPSMMIAYNYCFSTCIGRVHNISGDSAYEFGAWRLRIPKAKLEALVKKDLVHWSPVGVGFVKTSVRRGVLPALLRRILAARQAVKKSMKLQTDEAVKKAMHSRQLGLKLIANVTYGYTAANFSGRMPCVEVADSVVAKGRETLERAIKLVKNNTQWNVKVVYGDTDSMFVLVPGATRSEAFALGQQIADAVTADNPSPVALKLEKVYQPCILQTKKRYVGYMYESPDQQEPIYEAKGIETVRRDGCPAGVKLLKQCLCELFESGDMSRVKRLVTAALSRLSDGNTPVHDLFFTREYHGPSGYRPGAAAPPNEIAKRLSARDRRTLPRTGERVSWQVCAGAPDTPLVKLARAPSELVREPALTPHLAYYIARVILPPLHRCLSLLGADVFKWWNELGYSRCGQTSDVNIRGGIARYMCRERCAACGVRGARALCAACAARPRAAAVLAARQAVAVTHRQHCDEICASCCGHKQSERCENTECPVLWRRLTAQQRLGQVCDLIAHLPSHLADSF